MCTHPGYTCPECGSPLGDVKMDDSVSCPRCGLSAEALRELMRPLAERRGKLVCLEICKAKPGANKGQEYRYLITDVYSVDGADLGSQSFESHGGSCTISELVDKYIKDSPSQVFAIKTPYPVRNMRYGCLGLYEPLNKEEMAEFKRLLLSLDPERYALSFPS